MKIWDESKTLIYDGDSMEEAADAVAASCDASLAQKGIDSHAQLSYEKDGLFIKREAQSQAEHFFKTPKGFLEKEGISFDSSDEDRAKFFRALGPYATWGNDRGRSDAWYSMLVEDARELNSSAKQQRLGFQKPAL